MKVSNALSSVSLSLSPYCTAISVPTDPHVKNYLSRQLLVIKFDSDIFVQVYPI